MPHLFKEFRDFLLRGNIVALAVAFVMGVAFACGRHLVRERPRDADHRDDLRQAGLQRPDVHDQRRRLPLRLVHHGLITFAAIAAAVFFFIVKPMDMVAARRARGEVEPEAVSDEERRHQELLVALRARA